MNKSILKFAALTYFLSGLLTACGGNSSTPQPPPTPLPMAGLPVVGAASQSACEQAAQQDASACYVIDGSVASMYGVLGSTSLTTFNTFRQDHPDVTEIVMVDVPGSEDDEVNVQVGRAVRVAGLNTRLDANGSIASGGVDFFLAGIQRVVTEGATIGVHSWATGNNVQGSDLPRDDPQHDLYLNYYRDIAFPNFVNFYFFTLSAAPSTSIHNMTRDEIEQFQMATPVTTAVTSKSGPIVTVGTGNKIAPHFVNVDQIGTVYIEADSANTVFTVRSGVNYIDGGKGTDTIVFDGKKSEYIVTNEDRTQTFVDSNYERNGITVLTNVENVEFAGDD